MKQFFFLIIILALSHLAIGQVAPTNWFNSSNLELLKETKTSYSGSSALGVIVQSDYFCDANSLLSGTEIAVNPGATYTVTFSYKSSENVNFRLIPLYDGNTYDFFDTTTAGQSQWTQHKESAVVPAGSSTLQLSFKFCDTQDYIRREIQYLDNIELTVNGVSKTIENGDFENWPNLETSDWCAIQEPESGTIDIGENFNVYSEIYEAGLTEATGQAANVEAWIGLGSEDTHPSRWTTWIPASYHKTDGDNDVYMAEIGSDLSPGTYYYAARFRLDEGFYTYGGLNGEEWDDVDNSGGKLTVNFVEYNVEGIPYNKVFDDLDLEHHGWSTQLLSGNVADNWSSSYLNGSFFATVGYYWAVNSDTEAWLFSPAIDLSNSDVPLFNFINACSSHSGNDIEVYASSDYDGYSPPIANEWTKLSPDLSPGMEIEISSGNLNLSAFAGDTVYLAFRYKEAAEGGKIWYINDINVFEGAPEISDLTVTPSIPGASDEVNISASVIDSDAGIASVTLDWNTETYSGTISMSNGGSGDIYTTTETIQAMADGTVVYYTISAEDTNTYSSTVDSSYTVGDINETSEIQYGNIVLKLYPVPAEDEVWLKSKALMKRIELYNITGQKMLAKMLSAKKASINISDLKPGLYIFRVYAEEGAVYTKRFVKQ